MHWLSYFVRAREIGGLLVLRRAVFHDFCDELRNARGVKFSSVRQVQQFTLGHNGAGQDVNEDALGRSVRTCSLDTAGAQSLDNGTGVSEALGEARELHLASIGCEQKSIIISTLFLSS